MSPRRARVLACHHLRLVGPDERPPAIEEVAQAFGEHLTWHREVVDAIAGESPWWNETWFSGVLSVGLVVLAACIGWLAHHLN